MKKQAALIVFVLLSGWLLAVPQEDVEPLPLPLTNNAVAMLKVHGQVTLFSFMGMGAKKAWGAVTTESYSLDADSGKVGAIRPLPGTAGRIAAMAVGTAGHVFLFGGEVVSRSGLTPIPDVSMYEPDRDRWYRGPDMPIAVADAVIGVYRDRYIYILGGRSKQGPVSDVQMYDVEKNRWLQATPMPGAAVFGHAGAIVDDAIVYIDGAGKKPVPDSPGFAAYEDCWRGRIDHHEPQKIAWTKLPGHPGTARFRIAAGGSEKDERIYFAGGADHPYDFNGIGYDGKPAEPSPVTFAFNLRSGNWETIDEHTANPTMDHRGLLVTRGNLVIIGGMEAGQKVTGRVTVLPKLPKAK